jgi:hypothetical protein
VVKSGDWVARNWKDSLAGSNPTIGRVKGEPYRDGTEELADIVIYDIDGNKIGRVSEPFDGPKGFEPACALDGWTRIKKPDFPLTRAGYSNSLERL